VIQDMKSKNELDASAAYNLHVEIDNLGAIVNKIALEEEILKIDFEFPEKFTKLVDENGDN